jgi:hypothetical protein
MLEPCITSVQRHEPSQGAIAINAESYSIKVCYLPMQKVEKILFKISSAVVSPVSPSSCRSAL